MEEQHSGYRLTGIQFSLASRQQIEERSVAHICDSALHVRAEPKVGGPTDPRLGTTNRFALCATCKNPVETCTGHEGDILLPYPIPHIAFQTKTDMTLRRWMNVVCFSCSSLLLPDDYVFQETKPKARLKEAYDLTISRRKLRSRPLCCYKCGILQPMICVKDAYFRTSWLNESCMQRHFRVDQDGKGWEYEDNDPDKELRDPELVRQDEERYDYFVRRNFSNIDARDVLDAVTPETVRRFGINPEYSHPSSMILTSIVAAALPVRPTTSFEDGSKRKGFDDLTRKMVEIIKSCTKLRKEAEKLDVDLEDPDFDIWRTEHTEIRRAFEHMYITVSDFWAKDKAKVDGFKFTVFQQRARASQTCVTDRWKRKQGHFRGCMMGKRVNYSGRTVIVPAPNVDIDVVMIPATMACILTKPLNVTEFNRMHVQQLVRDGFVKEVCNPATGLRIMVDQTNQQTVVVHPGWRVHRQLMEGDRVLINRQPTLHKCSIMSFYVRIWDKRTIGFNLVVCTAFNADFDGDEMNIHVLQDTQAQTEANHLMDVVQQLGHPRANKPVIACIQDPIDASYFMSRQDCFFTSDEMMQFMMQMTYRRDAPPDAPLRSAAATRRDFRLPVPAIVKSGRGPLWTGKQLLSEMLPDIYMCMALSRREDLVGPAGPDALSADGILEIRRGTIVRGTLCVQSMGGSANSIVHNIYTYVSNEAAARFLSDVQRVLNLYIGHFRGMSFGIKDCLIDQEAQAQARQVYQEVTRHVERIEQLRDEFPNDQKVSELAETNISGSLGKAMTIVNEIARASISASDDNNFFIMSHRAKSKGSEFQIGQVMMGAGPQYITGKRPYAEFPFRLTANAPLPHQPKFNAGERLKEQGFVTSSYMRGMHPLECLATAQGGREGLVDTAVKSVSGDTVMAFFYRDNADYDLEEIGPWIDDLMARFARHVVRHGPDEANLEVLDLRIISSELIRVPTVNEYGRVTLADVTHVTRHDPGARLVRVRTRAGRSVTVTEAQSLLSCDRDGSLVQPLLGSLVQPGHLLPAFTDPYSTLRTRDGLVVPDTVMSVDVIVNPASNSNYRKMYDLTVPATLNFGLANGLMVRDTADTGYVQRRLVKGLESLRTANDFTVRDAADNMIQSVFGGDGLNSWSVRKVKIPVIFQSNLDLFERYTSDRLSEATRASELAELIAYRDQLRAVKLNAFQRTLDADFYIPFDVSVICDMMRCRSAHGPPDYERCVALVAETCRALDRFVPALFTKAHIQSELASGRIGPRGLNMCTVCMERVCGEAKRLHLAAIMHPGEAVGALAATSIGEPSTQMTLNTFHFAGTQKPGVVLGVPRLKELIQCTVTESMISPVMTLPLKPIMSHNRQAAETLARGLPLTMLRDITDDARLVYEPDVCQTHVAEDVDMVAAHLGFLREIAYAGACPWIVRFQLSKLRAVNRSLDPRAVADMVQEQVAESGLVISSDASSEQWVIRIYPINIAASVQDTLAKCTDVGRHSQRWSVGQSMPQHRSSGPVVARGSITSAKKRKYADLTQFVVHHPSAGETGPTELMDVTELTETTARTETTEPPAKRRRTAPAQSGCFSQMTICITGRMSVPRAELADLIRRHGGQVTDSVTEQTDYVVCASENLATTKAIQARELGVITVNEDWIMERVQEDEDDNDDDDNDDVDDGNDSPAAPVPTTRVAIEAEIPVPLHVVHPQIGRDRITVSDVIPWMVMSNIMDDMMVNLRISGIKGIKNATARKTERTVIDPVTGQSHNETEWVIDTEGTNLSAAMALHAIDDHNVISSSVMEIFEEFGIDAAAHALYQEMRATMAAESRVDDRYLELVIDEMFFSGTPMAMSRHGINRKSDIGVLGKVTFEESLQLLYDASAFAEFDPLRGVSEKLMVGRPVGVGTGCVEIVSRIDGCTVDVAGGGGTAHRHRADTYVVQSYFPTQNEPVVEPVPTMLVELMENDSYEYHLFQPAPPRVTKSNTHGLPPFRPSSPSHFIDLIQTRSTTDPYRPSSPSDFM